MSDQTLSEIRTRQGDSHLPEAMLPSKFRPYSVDIAQIKEIVNEMGKAMSMLFGHPNRPGLLQLAPAIAVYGSARPAEDSDFLPHRKIYKMFRQCGHELARKSYIVVTGGGPGAMEAANRGCMEGGSYTVGVGIKLPFEQTNNPYLHGSMVARGFSPRKASFAKASVAYICGPGGMGTLDELFEMWRLEYRANRPASKPIVLMDKAFWQPVDDLLRMYADKYQVITPKELSMVTLVDTPLQAVKYLKTQHAEHPEIFETPRLYDKQMLKRVAGDLRNAMMKLTPNAPYVNVIGGSEEGLSDKATARKAGRLGELLGAEGVPTLTTGVNKLITDFNSGVRKAGGTTTGLVNAADLAAGKPALDSTVPYHYRFTAEILSMKYGSRADVFFPGGIGMLDRLFEQLTLIQTSKITNQRVICVGKEFFQPMADMLEEHFYKNYRTTSKDDHKLLEIVDSADEAFEIVRSERAKTIAQRQYAA